MDCLAGEMGQDVWAKRADPDIPEHSVQANPCQYTEYASDFAIWKQD